MVYACICKCNYSKIGIKYIGELTARTNDALVSFGERMAVRIVAANLNKLGKGIRILHRP